ncbi:MAG TPA: RibD family protein [Phenylobacterium sp.]|nr:RibD family protein [Phenylobacterium sp.]
MITLKLATSLDGRIATASGESRWITGPAAREQTHRLRAAHDAVLIGVETAIADDPALTVRLESYSGPQPARIILDRRQRLPRAGRLAGTARDIPTYVVTTRPLDPILAEAGLRPVLAPDLGEGRPDLVEVVALLKAAGLSRLFVEGGGQVAASFLRCGLVDRLEWFRAPRVVGGEGRPASGALALTALSAAPRLRRVDIQALGDDIWERYERI